MANRAIQYVLISLFALTAFVEGSVDKFSLFWICTIVLASFFTRVLIQRKRYKRAHVIQDLLDYVAVFAVALLIHTDSPVYYLIFLFPAIRISLRKGRGGSLIVSGVTAACLFLIGWIKGDQQAALLFLLWNTITVAVWYIGSVTDSKQSYQLLAYMDPLTGAYNRRFLQDRLNDILYASVIRDEPITLMMLDLDHFKQINDTYGHDAGDQILKEFTDIVKHQLRKTDTAIRFGGEEFAVLLPKLGIEQAEKIAERIRQKVESHAFHVDGHAERLHITVSIGVTAYSHPQSKYDLLRAADQALYIAKEGRNRVAAV